jgi:L-lactate dehydrogenase complex protein LldE
VVKLTNLGSRFFAKVTYHDSCSALRECKIKTQPRELLKNVEGLELVEMDDCETCCGFGGSFAVKYEPISVAMSERKIEHAINSGPEYIVSTDYSCLLQLDSIIKVKGYNLKTLHLADVLAKGLE